MQKQPFGSLRRCDRGLAQVEHVVLALFAIGGLGGMLLLGGSASGRMTERNEDVHALRVALSSNEAANNFGTSVWRAPVNEADDSIAHANEGRGWPSLKRILWASSVVFPPLMLVAGGHAWWNGEVDAYGTYLWTAGSGAAGAVSETVTGAVALVQHGDELWNAVADDKTVLVPMMASMMTGNLEYLFEKGEIMLWGTDEESAHAAGAFGVAALSLGGSSKARAVGSSIRNSNSVARVVRQVRALPPFRQLHAEWMAEKTFRLGRNVFIGFDYDGTLRGFVPDAMKALASPRVVIDLRRLGAVVPTGIITGRSYDQVVHLFHGPERIRNLWGSVLHGLTEFTPGTKPTPIQLHPEMARALTDFRDVAAARFAPRGAVIEEKSIEGVLTAVTVHTRDLSLTSRTAAEALDKEIQTLIEAMKAPVASHGAKADSGPFVKEFGFNPGDKGVAFSRLMERIGADRGVFTGDAPTDLSAIRAAVESGGHGFFVLTNDIPKVPQGAVVTGTFSGVREVQDYLRALVRRYERHAPPRNVRD